MTELEVSEMLTHDRVTAKQRPLGVWVLTALDVLVLGLSTMIMAGKQIVVFLGIGGSAPSEAGGVLISNLVGLVVILYGFCFLFAFAICLAARGAWLGKDRARAVLVVLITINLFVVAPVNIFAVFASIVLIPIHWWYFWLPITLAFYE
jgi:hypothetical protein